MRYTPMISVKTIFNDYRHFIQQNAAVPAKNQQMIVIPSLRANFLLNKSSLQPSPNGQP